MKNYLLPAFNALKVIAQQFAVLLITIGMLLSLSQTAAMAANSPEPRTHLGSASPTEEIRDRDNSAAKAERREWQSQASSVREDKENKPTTVGEKLNVDELVKGYHPEREAEKRSVPTP